MLKYFEKIERMLSFFSLKRELEEYDTINTEIDKGISFRGTNLWILMFAIVIASIGLNTNSTAVIIGAMLISPLMGPIIGMGYAVARYDFSLLRRAVKNFSFAVLASLFTSFIYFSISPLSAAHSELLARTSPTIYDVLIALFGGLAGVIAISSKMKGNVIPGVAIATALMPPICTAGYGLASFQLRYFFGALYLFTINTVFIAIATMLVCKYLRVPLYNIIDLDRRKKINKYVTIIITITLLPSIYMGYRLVQNEQFMLKCDSFVKDVSIAGSSYLLNKEIDANSKSIKLVYAGFGLNDNARERIRDKAIISRIDPEKVFIEEGFDASDAIEHRKKAQTEHEVLTSRINALSFSYKKSEAACDSLLNIPMMGRVLYDEIKSIFPQIRSCSYSETIVFSDTITSERVPIILFSINKLSLTQSDKDKIELWIKQRLNRDEIFVYYEERNVAKRETASSKRSAN